MRLVLGFAVVAWLVIGAVAAAQRGYFSADGVVNCNGGATSAVTVAAGPLNYAGVDPRISCKAPRPSR